MPLSGVASNIRASINFFILPLNLTGSICALVTPFQAHNNALDFDVFARLIDYQLMGDTQGMVVAGSTGEAAALDEQEYAQLIAFVANRVNGRVPVLAGTGLPSTYKTIAQTKRAREAGADAALVVTPAYVRPTQEGLYRHFVEVAEQGGLPVVLYNVPTRTACDLLPETVERLYRHPNIMGIKEAHTFVERMQTLKTLRSETFCVWSGDDPTCARDMLAGRVDGVISVAANVVPRLIQDLCKASLLGDEVLAQRLDTRLRPLYDFLAIEPNPIPVKWCLAQFGFGESHLRLPLTTLSAVYHALGKNILLALDVIEAGKGLGKV